MKLRSSIAVAAVLLLTARTVGATLTVGDQAPDFTAPGAYAGEEISIELSRLLDKGLVVMYFFPSAYINSAQTREFARKIDRFQALGVQVLGISRDGLDTLAGYSRNECDGKFPVASANEALVNAYQVNDGAMFNSNTTYVIDRSGRIALVLDEQDRRSHVESSLAFIKSMSKQAH